MSELEPRLQAALGGAYRIERELGGGGMSRVFIAEEIELGRKVVVKVLPPDMAAGLNAERFRREIQLAASLQHPHIVPLIAAGRTGDLVWYTMPLIEGQSLRARLAKAGELPIGDAVRILRDVADAPRLRQDIPSGAPSGDSASSERSSGAVIPPGSTSWPAWTRVPASAR